MKTDRHSWRPVCRDFYPTATGTLQRTIKKGSLLLTALLAFSATVSKAQTPFTCSNMAYQVASPTIADPSTLYSYNINSGVRTAIAPLGIVANSLGYYTGDNMLWGFSQTSNQVIRIDATGAITNFTIPDLPAIGYYVGEILPAGYIVLLKPNDVNARYYVVDINPGRATYLQLVDPAASYVLDTAPYGTAITIGGNPTTRFDVHDIAYNTADGLLHAVINGSSVTAADRWKEATLNPATGVISIAATAISGEGFQNGTPGGVATAAFGAVFYDANNTLYAFDNNNGRFFKVNGTTATLLSQSVTSDNNDGASCPTAVLSTTISGTVFNDVISNGTVDGTGINPGGLYAVLYDNTTGMVADTASIATNGTYTFNATPGNNYSVIITTAPPAIGSVGVPASTLPGIWSSTGEFLGSGIGSDGAPDGVLSLGLVTTALTNANFGIINSNMGYIYVHKKTLDESSSTDFTFTLSGGPTPVGNFGLNDNPANVQVRDLGAAQNGRLWVVGVNNVLYYRDQGSSVWIATAVTNAARVDGGPGNTCYWIGTGGGLNTHDGTNQTQIYTASGNSAVDVGDGWDNRPYIITNGGRIYRYSGTGNTTIGGASWPLYNSTATGLTQLDVNPSSGQVYARSADDNVYAIPAGTGATSLGKPPGSNVASTADIGVGVDGGVYSIWSIGTGNEYHVYKWVSGTTWSAKEDESREAIVITGGVGGQMWANNFLNTTVPYGNIITRVTDAGGIHWLDDERVRTSPSNGNSIIIAVAPGTYSLVETLPPGWDLSKVDVYDPTNNSTATVATQTTSVNVAVGEVVNLVYQNNLTVSTPIGTSCGINYIQTFGNGAPVFSPVIPGLTTYHYLAANSFQDGYYSLVKNASGFSSALTNHTGDANGYFMMVNAGYSKDEFFRQRVSGLSVGSTYTLAFWAADVSASAPVRPSITLGATDVNTGAVLGSVNTGNITSTNWVKYTFLFTANSSSVDLFIRNNGVGGNGNDVAIDDISFNLAPIDTPVVSITSQNVCATGASITVSSPTGANIEYSRDGGANYQSSPVFTNVPPGTYTITARFVSTSCTALSAPVTVTPIICGNVLNDANGMNNSLVDGTGTNAGGLMAVLISGGLVVDSVLVNADGSYAFPNVTPGTYTVLITDDNTPVTIGAAAPAVSLPSGWLTTGEGLTAAGDGTPNSTVPGIIVTATANINNVNFGIEQPPVANPVTATTQQNPGGTGQVVVPVLQGSDPEQGTFPGTGNGDTIRIVTLPANGTLYYNGVAVTAGQQINGYNPALLTVNPNDGITSLTFTFSEVDAAGIASPPATVTMPFTTAVPFTCEGLMYEVSGISSISSSLNKFNANTGQFTTLASYSTQTNAIGYNPFDNMVWGLQSGTQLVRIDGNGVVQNMTVPNLVLSGVPAIGAISPNGYYYVSSSTSFSAYYVVDVNPARSSYLQLVDRVTFAPITAAPYTFAPSTATFGMGDWAWNSADGKLWGVSHQQVGGTPVNYARLYNMDPATGIVTSDMPVLTPALGTTGTLGSVVIDGSGFMYAKQNNQGRIYKIDMTTGVVIEITSALTGASFNDGAVCPTAILSYPIAGHVYNDINGLTDSAVNGTGTNTGGILYAVLYDNTTGMVIDTAVVKADGTYLLNGNPGNNASIYLTTTPVTPLQSALPVVTQPAGWVYTGEAGNAVTGSGNDGTVNGILTLGPLGPGVINANFGIEQPPSTNTTTLTSQINPGGTVSVPVTTGFSGTDPDGGVIDSIRILTFPTNATSITVNGTTYTSGTFPPGGVSTPTNATGQPTIPVSVDPIDGSVSVVISYTTIDNAGQADPTPGSLTVPFGTIAINGTVFHDANGLNPTPVNTIDGPGANPGGLHAVLVDNSTGKVVATVPVAGDGTYSFPGVSAGNYNVIITTATATVGNNPPAITMPAGWGITGENLGAGAGSDGVPNGTLALGVVSSNVSNANFGVEQLPTPIPATTTINQPVIGQLITLSGGSNPPVPSGTDPEDGALGATNTIVITQLPANTTLLYNGNPVTAGDIIPGFDPALLQIEITAATIGTTSTAFQFNYADAAGLQSGTPATYTLNWGAPLPVDYVRFTATAEQRKVRLDWTTAQELHNKGFGIERSTDGSSWKVLGFVNSKGTDGNSSTTLDYVFYDNQPVAGQNLYRLNQVDIDGNHRLSEVRSIVFDAANKIKVYPNPATDQLHIVADIAGSIQQVKLLDVRGREVYSSTENTGTIYMHAFAQGVYLIQVTLKDGSISSVKVEKQ